MKIDVSTHVQLERYKEAVYQYSDRFAVDKSVQDKRLTLTDLNMRMDITEEAKNKIFEGNARRLLKL